MGTTDLQITVAEIMQRSVASVAENDELASALRLMLWRQIRHLPVVNDGALVGLLSERDMIAAASREACSIGALGKVRDVMRRSVSSIAPTATVPEAAAMMAVEKIGCLPVMEDSQIVGMVTTTDVLGASAWVPIKPRESEAVVADVMTRNPAVARESELLSVAAARMFKRRVRHLPVLSEQGRAVGMLSERDVRSVFGNPLQSNVSHSEPPRVASAMTCCVRTISSDAPITKAFEVLLDERFGALPVTDNQGVVVGMLSYLDLLAWSRPDKR